MIVYRTEEKYVLTQHQLYNIRSSIKALMQKDKNTNTSDYWIRSLYFDTPENQDFYDKVAGIDTRMKFRLRIYDRGAKVVKMEMKNKRDAYSWKETIEISYDKASRLIDGDDIFGDLNNYNSEKALFLFKQKRYQPKVLIDYEREAYQLPFNNIRITFDKNVRVIKSSDIFGCTTPMICVLPEGHTIMEVKYNSFLPGYIKNVLSATEMTKQSVSKYALGRIAVG